MALLEVESLVTAEAVFADWLENFGQAIESQDSSRIAEFFTSDGYWKDILAFTWGYRTFHGKDEIERSLDSTLDLVRPRSVRQARGRAAPRLVRRSRKNVIEAYFDFDTEAGRGTAFVRLLADEEGVSGPLTWTLLTTLQDLRGFEERTDDRRPTGVEYSENFAGDNWLDKRIKAQAYRDRDPEVIIVGGGQGGIVLAARLGQMGVDALIVERNAELGDNWRHRYHSLTLHNEVWANSMPYMPFPPTWPTFVPKDKFAAWLESYAEAMELNVWTGTEFLDGSFDEETKTWTARLTTKDGAEREVHAPHLVLATGGVSGVPNVPSLPGVEEFEGELIHSSQFTSGILYKGKRAIVIGTGNSGHDVAQDLQSNGAEVTLVQRSPTCVVSLVPSGTMVYSLYSEGPPPDDIDLITAAIPYPVLTETYQWLTKKTCAIDKELIDKLNVAGFETSFGEDDTGFHMLYLRRGGGYYINVGCSDLIAEGKIGLVQARDIDQFTAKGVRLKDGSIIESDLIVLATGYKNQQEGVRRMLGDDIADRVGTIWGFDDNKVMRNMWQQTKQEGFWIMGGSLMESRLYSKFLALQIKADIEGILPHDLAI